MPPLELPEFEWSEAFACGVDLIDRQHRNLVDLINLLRSAILRGDTVSSANSVESLQAYARYHFAYEESWARDRGMPQAALDQHARRHQAFADRIQAMAEQDSATHVTGFRLDDDDALDRDHIARMRRTVAALLPVAGMDAPLVTGSNRGYFLERKPGGNTASAWAFVPMRHSRLSVFNRAPWQLGHSV